MVQFRNSLIVGIMGLIVMSITLGLFFTWTTDRVAAQWAGLIFFLFAQVILFGESILLGLWKGTFGKLFTSVFVSILSTSYFVVTLLFFVIAKLFANHFALFMTMELVTLGGFAFVALLFVLFSNKNSADTQKAMSTRQTMLWCTEKIHQLSSHSQSKVYEKEFNRIYESMKYAEKSVLSQYDQQIIVKLEMLESTLDKENEDTTKEIPTLLAEISALMTQRSFDVSQSKRGGF